uniref:Protein kinase domain-containing protein n=1 Tax=Salix viminalis TaxID=40686 RepID=A0A6N2MCC5_SALVM
MVSKMDGHEVIEQIGRGTFGAAFLALHKMRIKDFQNASNFLGNALSTVGDFGLAKLLNKEDHASTVRFNCRSGTPNYICVQNFLQTYLMDTNQAFGL